MLPIHKVFTKRVHVFKAGPQTSAQGVEREFSPRDLDDVVQSYDPGTHEAPVVIGHAGDNDSAPSYGWIKKFVRQGDDLYADVNFTDVAKDLVKDGHYRKVSISFYSPSSPINPHKGKWSARHLALLGASPPAVKGLEPFSFSEKDGVFDYATALTPDNIFDTDLGPTMIEEKSPLEMLKERLDEIRGELSDSLKALEENQNKQNQVDVGQEETAQPAEVTTSQFSELRKKVSEASQKLANLETMAPSDSYDEGIKRVSAKGAHGHNVQVVEEVFEEKSHKKTKKTDPEKVLDIAEEIEDSFGEDGVTRKVSKGAHGQEVQVVEQVYKEKGVDRKVADGAHGHKVQVVEEVFEEKVGKKKKGMEPVIVEEDLEEGEEFKEKGGVPAGMSLEGEEATEEEVKGKKKSKAPTMMDGEDMERGDEEFKEKKKKAPMMMEDDEEDMDVEDMEDDGEFMEGMKHHKGKKHASMEKDGYLSEEEDEEMFVEGVGDKSAKGGKVSFGKHSERKEDVAGRGSTGRSEDDSYADRQAVGKGEEDGREMTSDDDGEQDTKRGKTAQNSDQDKSRERLAKASPSENTDAESRWAEQGEGKDRAHNANQYDDSGKDLPERSRPGTSDGNEPHGRDGGPTKVSRMMEEDPSNEEIAVPLKSTKGNKTVRVLHQQSGDKRAALKGGEIPDHADEVDHGEGVGHKTTSGGRVSFGTHPERKGDPTGREVKAASEDDRKYVEDSAKASAEDREGITRNGRQDADRVKTAKHSEQDADRVKTAKAVADDRWEDQPEGAKKAMNNDQFDDSHNAGVSDGNEPYGRDGGPTKVPTIVEEDPYDEEFVVPLKNVKQSDNVRVVYQKSGEKRAPVKGGAIDHAEGEADGLTREPKKAKVSDGTDPRGRDNGPTKFPTLSEEDPDDLEMAVDLEDATQNKKVRIVRQKSGDQPTLDHKEKDKTPMTKTGKGSTYGQKTPVLMDEDEIEEGYGETEDYGMGSLGQAKAMGYPTAMFEELKALKEENDRLKKEYEGQKIRARKAKIAEFVENLYVQGKLTDGIIPQGKLQNYCEGLEFGTLEFAEGESATTTLFTLLEKLPNLVYFGEVVSNASYQDPEDDDLDPHERAMKMVANGEASDYVEAIKRCIPWGAN